ncbi:MAG: PilT/PilU family type 4a pilus ATPase [Patescibacteria group bacterium]
MAFVDIKRLLQAAAQQGASDLHIVVGRPPVLRVNGELTDTNASVVTPQEAERAVSFLLTREQMQRYTDEKELDFSYQIEDGTRFRINIHREKEHAGLVARVVPNVVPTMEELGLPPLVGRLAHLHNGLLLFTGPTGSGKSSSLAAIINYVNQNRNVHVVTLEDPIEFVFQSEQSLIRQRQLGVDFISFDSALKHVVRQDPNIIMVGEMRDLETVAAAMTLAETGHLILATLHTPSAAQTVDRIIDFFPPHQQQQMRQQLSLVLRAVVAQTLLLKVGGGRIAAREILLNTPAVANLISENKVHQIKSVIQTSAAEGMQTLDQDLKRLVTEGLVEVREASVRMISPSTLEEV